MSASRCSHPLVKPLDVSGEMHDSTSMSAKGVFSVEFSRVLWKRF